jgi:membrane protease YdiL (CAAX protease family)
MNQIVRAPLSAGPAMAFLMKLPVPALIPLALAASYLLGLVVAVPVGIFFPELDVGGPRLHLNGPIFVVWLVAACVVIPVAETLVFQWACIRLLREKLKWRASRAIAASAVLFGLAHTYSVPYVLIATIGGVVLGIVFVIEQEKNGSPFWVVATIHALRNLIATFAFATVL